MYTVADNFLCVYFVYNTKSPVYKQKIVHDGHCSGHIFGNHLYLSVGSHPKYSLFIFELDISDSQHISLLNRFYLDDQVLKMFCQENELLLL